MNMNFKVVFDYKGDGILRFLSLNENDKFRENLEDSFVYFHNLYADYVNSDKGYAAWNQEWENTNNDSEQEYFAFIASKGNAAIKEILAKNKEFAIWCGWLDFYIEPKEAQLHCKVKGTPIDISLHLEEIK